MFSRGRLKNLSKIFSQSWIDVSFRFFNDSQGVLLSKCGINQVDTVVVHYALINFGFHWFLRVLIGPHRFFQGVFIELWNIVLPYSLLIFLACFVIAKEHEHPWISSTNLVLLMSIFALGTCLPIINWVFRFLLLFTFIQSLRLLLKNRKVETEQEFKFLFLDKESGRIFLESMSIEMEKLETENINQIVLDDSKVSFKNEPQLLAYYSLRLILWFSKKLHGGSRLTQAGWGMGIIGWLLVLGVFLGDYIIRNSDLGSGKSFNIGVIFILMSLAAFILFVVGLVLGITDRVSQKEKSIITTMTILLNGIPLGIIAYQLLKALAK